MIITLLIDLLYALALLAFAPMLIYRALKQNRYRRGWSHRFGFVPIRTGNRPCIWIHAVSMGEMNATVTLVNGLKTQLDCDIVISTTTDTGYDRACQLYGKDHLVFFYPFDFSRAVRRAFDRIRPSLCVLMELEVWHNFVATAAQRTIPVIVVNGRISSAKGFPRYRRIAPLVRPSFARLTRVLVQDAEYADRFHYLGVPKNRITVAGSLKYDTAQINLPVSGADSLDQNLHLTGHGPIWVAGSTGPGEEEAILAACQPLLSQPELAGLKLVIVPRKPERFDEVARLIEQSGMKFIRYSLVKNGQLLATGGEQVILGDTMGDLRKFYALASLIFVGRSLVPMGGSDMIEAAALAKPVLVGPHTENFADSMARLRAGRGIAEIASAAELTQAARHYLTQPAEARALGQAGREVVLNSQGATTRTIAAIRLLIDS